MAYCLPSDVRLLIHTDLEDSEIEDLIREADAELDEMLGGASMSSDLKKYCSKRLAAITIARREPAQYSLGNIRVDYGKRVAWWSSEVKRKVVRVTGSLWAVADPLED